MENKDFDILLELEKEEMISTLEEKQETKEIQNTYIYQTIVAKPEEKPKKWNKIIKIVMIAHI